MFEKIADAWQILAAIVTASGGALTWYFNHKKRVRQVELDRIKADEDRKKADEESSAYLFAALEELKKKTIAQTLREVRQATELAEKSKLIEQLRVHCPDCFSSFMDKLNDNGPQDN